MGALRLCIVTYIIDLYSRLEKNCYVYALLQQQRHFLRFSLLYLFARVATCRSTGDVGRQA